jgi:hypothetical protein
LLAVIIRLSPVDIQQENARLSVDCQQENVLCRRAKGTGRRLSVDAFVGAASDAHVLRLGGYGGSPATRTEGPVRRVPLSETKSKGAKKKLTATPPHSEVRSSGCK